MKEHSWKDFDKKVEFYTNKTIIEDPSIAEKYLQILETYDLKPGQIFGAFSLKQPKQTYFMAVYLSAEKRVFMKEKFFKFNNALNVMTKNKGHQKIWFYEEE